MPMRSIEMSRPPQNRVPHVSRLRRGFRRMPSRQGGNTQIPSPPKYSPSPHSLVPSPCFLRHGLTAILLAATIILTTAAADPTARFDKLGHQIMCSCGCNQILLECNHVGCPNSDGMRHELMTGVVNGDSNNTIFQAFVQKYGPTVLAAPTGEGFNIVAWVMPFAVLFLGLGGTALLIRRWKLRSVPMPPPSATPRFSDIRDRIRRETEL
jgi:cytochrome c-type biogenesis protein CcmH/NrfF